MPKGKITKSDIKTYVEKLKGEISGDYKMVPHEKTIVHTYLNKVLDKITEYR